MMPKLDVEFTGWITGVVVTHAMRISDGILVPVGHLTDRELVTKIWEGELSLQVRSMLGGEYNRVSVDIDVSPAARCVNKLSEIFEPVAEPVAEPKIIVDNFGDRNVFGEPREPGPDLS
jgi:hypothetical protein